MLGVQRRVKECKTLSLFWVVHDLVWRQGQHRSETSRLGSNTHRPEPGMQVSSELCPFGREARLMGSWGTRVPVRVHVEGGCLVSLSGAFGSARWGQAQAS